MKTRYVICVINASSALPSTTSMMHLWKISWTLFFFFLTLYGDEAAIINPSLKDQTKASKDEKELTEALFPIALAEAEF